MKPAKKAVRKPKSIPPQLTEAAIEALKLSNGSTMPSIEGASAVFSSSIESVSPRLLSTDILTLAEAAALLKCCTKTLAKEAAAGNVPAKRVGAQWRFYRPALEQWLREVG